MGKRILFLLLLIASSDFYFFQALETVTSNERLILICQLIAFLPWLGAIAGLLFRRFNRTHEKFISGLFASFLLIYVPKFTIGLVLLCEDIFRVLQGFPSRHLAISEVALLMGGFTFLLVLFGLTRGKHFYRVRRTTLFFDDLPEAFDGFTLTQLSDVHSGSFGDARAVQAGLQLVNSQHSDVILFTGDLVNNQAVEMEPWISTFSSLEAPMGKYSVLGNHDYGDYVQWESQEKKRANFERLKQIHAEIGFRLLLNQSVSLEKNGQQLTLVGVENWGKGGFQKYGDLRRALAGVAENSFKILLSHDPSHWDSVVLQHPSPIQLTLSGHTHGMQFGIEFLGFKWSPIQYIYRHWAGLYKHNQRYLYVNRGFGYLGLKGRVGIWPEITVITLKRSKKD
jgi:predicted MPP superfamily phosphohydrolase